MAQYAEPNRNPPEYSGSGHCLANPNVACVTNGNCPTGDTCQPPEIPYLLNGGSLTQQKTGSLLIGNTGGTSKLCLNASSSTAANDPTNCVVSWDDALGKAGSFLHLSNVAAGTGTNYQTDYPVQDVGYLRLKANGDASHNQLYSLYVEAGANTNGVYDANGFGARALMATDYTPVPGTSYAGYLLGHTKVDTGTHNTFLCLNAADDISVNLNGKGCIDTWADVLVPSGSIGLVKLQAGPAYTADGGKSGVSGTGFMGSTVVGSTAGVALALTCGDGICSSNTNPNETTASCALDCGASAQPTFAVSPLNGGNSISITSQPQASGSTPTQLVIVRRSNAAPQFKPQQGSLYADGQAFGTEAIVKSLQVAGSGVVTNFFDTGLVNGTTYYYQAWQGNNYPRYAYPGVVQSSTPTIASPVTLTVALVPSGVGAGDVIGPLGVGAGADAILCEFNCTEQYNRGPTIQITARQASSTFLYWLDDCSSFGFALRCNLAMDGNKRATAVFGTCTDSGCIDPFGNPVDPPPVLR